MTRALFAVLLAALTVFALPLTSAAGASAPGATCDMREEMVRTVHELGDDLHDWRTSRATHGYWGFVPFDQGYARIHPEMPCEHVADTVRHEWLHLQQVRLYGDRDAVYARYGSRPHFERVASCGALLLGSRRLSYLDPEHPMHSGPCSLLDIFEAVKLISFRAPVEPT